MYDDKCKCNSAHHFEYVHATFRALNEVMTYTFGTLYVLLQKSPKYQKRGFIE